jgi:hypothetical protein
LYVVSKPVRAVRRTSGGRTRGKNDDIATFRTTTLHLARFDLFEQPDEVQFVAWSRPGRPAISPGEKRKLKEQLQCIADFSILTFPKPIRRVFALSESLPLLVTHSSTPAEQSPHRQTPSPASPTFQSPTLPHLTPPHLPLSLLTLISPRNNLSQFI